MSDRVCYRYRTAALVGPWRRSLETAHEDAIEAGQMERCSKTGEWLVSGEIETSCCDKGGPCGGGHPTG